MILIKSKFQFLFLERKKIDKLRCTESKVVCNLKASGGLSVYPKNQFGANLKYRIPIGFQDISKSFFHKTKRFLTNCPKFAKGLYQK